jgi:hypothetical protein
VRLNSELRSPFRRREPRMFQAPFEWTAGAGRRDHQHLSAACGEACRSPIRELERQSSNPHRLVARAVYRTAETPPGAWQRYRTPGESVGERPRRIRMETTRTPQPQKGCGVRTRPGGRVRPRSGPGQAGKLLAVRAARGGLRAASLSFARSRTGSSSNSMTSTGIRLAASSTEGRSTGAGRRRIDAACASASCRVRFASTRSA